MKFRMDEARPMTTPMYPSITIDWDEKGNNTLEKEYIGRIGSLIVFNC